MWGLKLVRDGEIGEEAEWLLRQAWDRGAEISRRTLVDWHAKGLLPKPAHVGQGRGRGSKSLYPASTLKQLLACDALMRRHRNNERVAWELWARGYEVDETYAQKAFARAHQELAKFHRRLALLTETERGWRVLTASLTKRAQMGRLPYFLGSVKQRLGLRIESFLGLMVNITAGNFMYDGDQEDGVADESLLARATNLQAAKNKKATGDPIFIDGLPSEFARTISLVSSEIGNIADPAYFDPKHLGELRETTTELYFLVAAHNLTEVAHKSKMGKSHPFYKILPSILQRASPDKIATMVLIWSALRKRPEFADGSKKLITVMNEIGMKKEDIPII